MHRSPLALSLASLLILPAAGCRFFDGAPGDSMPPTDGEPGLEEEPVEEQELPAAAYELPVLPPMFLLSPEYGDELAEEAELLRREQDGSRSGLADYANFLAGATAAVAGVAIGTYVLAPPAAVLADTYHQGAVANPSAGVWVFTKQTALGNTVYDAELTAVATWWGWELEMVIDAAGPNLNLVDHVWFDGELAWGGAVGSWTLYTLQGGYAADFNYLVDGAEHIASLSSASGSLTSIVVGDLRSLVGIDDGSGEVAAVAWDAVTYEGGVSLPDYLGGLLSCWDSALLNASCP